MNKSKNKKKIILLIVAVMLLSNTIVLADDNLRAETFSVKEYGGLLNKVTGKSITYTTSTLQGHDATVFTITKGKYKPINIVEFLKHLDSSSYTVISQEKTVYIQEDLEGRHLLYLNEKRGSMEPIVLLMENGHKAFIRFSKEFLEDNNITMAEGHELFEDGWDKNSIWNEIESISYIDFTGEKLLKVESTRLEILGIGDNGFEEGVLYLSTGNTISKEGSNNGIDFSNPIKVKPNNTKTDESKKTEDPKDDIFGVPNKPVVANKDLNPPTLPLGERDKVAENIWGKDKGTDRPKESEKPKEAEGKYIFKGVTNKSTKQEIESKQFSIKDFTDLYSKALTNQWENSSEIHALYNTKLETSTDKDKEGTINQPPVPKIDNDKVKDKEVDTTPAYKDPSYLEDVWTGGNKDTIDCYGMSNNEVEIQECLDKTSGGMSMEDYSKLFDRDGLDESGNPIKPGLISPGDYTAEDLNNMSDDEFNSLFGSGSGSSSGTPGGDDDPNYSIDDIVKGKIGSSKTKPESKYKMTLGKMETSKILTDKSQLSDEHLLLAAYQELDFNVYNEKMEKINPKYIPIIEPQVKKVDFITYNNHLDKSTLLLKFTTFFILLTVMTITAIVKSRGIRDTKKKEKFKEGLKFREEEIKFSNFLDDITMEVE